MKINANTIKPGHVLQHDGSLWVATSNRDGRGSPRSGDDRIVAIRVARR